MAGLIIPTATIFTTSDASFAAQAAALGVTLPKLSAYDLMPQVDALKAFYPLNEGSGTVATDIVNGNNAAIVGGAWTANGLQFAGANGNGINFPFPLADPSFEVVMLVRPDSSGAAQQCLLGPSDYNVRGFNAMFNASDSISQSNYYSGGANTNTFTAESVKDKWRLLSFSRNVFSDSIYPGTTTISVATSQTLNGATVYNTTLLVDASAGAVALTLPLAGSMPLQGTSSIFTVQKIDTTSNAVSFALSGSDTWVGAAPANITVPKQAWTFQWGSATAWQARAGSTAITSSDGAVASVVTPPATAQSFTPHPSNLVFGNNGAGVWGTQPSPFKGSLGFIGVWNKTALAAKTANPERANALAYLATLTAAAGITLGA